MNFNLVLLFPEWVILGILVLLALAEMTAFGAGGAFLRNDKILIRTVRIGSLLAFLAVLPFAGRIDYAFGGMFILDPLATFFKAFFALTLIVIVQMSREFFAPASGRAGEFFLILWTSLLGLFILVSANDLLLIFISLEIVTLSFYIMAAYMKRSLLSIEAGLKYLILGSLASAFFIYGISLIYLASGFTSLADIRDFFAAHPADRGMLAGLLMIIAGIGFKVASVPFQFWVPDVYEGAPTPVVGFLSVGSKAAGFAILLRILFSVFGPFDGQRVMLFSFFAIATLIYGNLGALVQTNIKRLFGYSSIGHAGYLLIGIAAGKEAGTSSVLYYLMAYAVTTLAVFLVLTIAGTRLQSDEISAYRGLSQKSPLLAGVLFMALLSSAGVPPLAGFFGKFLILLAAVAENLRWLAVIGALGVAVSLYYYLSIVRTMYFEEPQDPSPISLAFSSRFFLILLSGGVLLVGLWQAPFLYFAENAARYLF